MRIHKPIPFPLLMGVQAMPTDKPEEKKDAPKPSPSLAQPPAPAPKPEPAKADAKTATAALRAGQEADDKQYGSSARADAHSAPEPVPSGYVVNHAYVGGHAHGAKVTAEQLVPVPKDAKDEDAKKLRDDGIRRLTDLGAVLPVYDDEEKG